MKLTEDSKIEELDKAIQEFAPEIADIYYIREDESEEQQIKTGRLHENRILGIILKFFIEGKKKVTTSEVEQEYKRYFKDIARSTVSTYLNMLKKESTLYKERDGRIVYYIFYEDPPTNIKPFWFTRIFCIVPAYFVRANYFAQIFLDAKSTLTEYIGDDRDFDLLLDNFKFLIGIIILYILKNRTSKCILCQFGKQETYEMMIDGLEQAIRDRSDVLPDELIEILINYGEIPIFGGINIDDPNMNEKIIKEVIELSRKYKKDLEFQIMVSQKRMELRLRQKESNKEDVKK
ncbi:MAG TPA: hypothetical protein ENI51_12050 [Candidatus Atribacteria bacterium]|nr:hypothetical protein [Candidatus Atribacteria bacterium]